MVAVSGVTAMDNKAAGGGVTVNTTGSLATVPRRAEISVVPAPVPVPDGAFVAMYVGAHGTYSSLETVLDAAERMRDDGSVRFVLVGGGDRKPALQADAERRGLRNVVFVDPVPKRDVPAWLARADVCLLPYQDRPLFAGALPNKTFDYMGAAKPIVAAVPPGELSRLVERAGCGFAIPPEDADAMATTIRSLAANRALAARLGAAGAGFVCTHYDRRILAERFVEVVEGCHRSAGVDRDAVGASRR
jgi:glycosyltransferase involved in cell wall biosynthesis